MSEQNITSEEPKPVYLSPGSPVTESMIRSLEMLLKFAPAREYRDVFTEIYNLYVLHHYHTFTEKFTDEAEKMILLQSFLLDCEEKTSRQ